MLQIRCRACRSFRDGNRDERECTGCGRALRVKNGYCRLCWIQLSGGRAWEGTAPPAVAALTAAGVKIGHHQLFFDRMAPRTGAAPAARRAPRGLPPAAAWAQPELPAPPPARAGAGPARPWPPRSASPTASPRPAAGPARSAAGSARDWPSRWTATGKARTSGGRGPAALHAVHLSAGHVAEVLRQAGLLHDDRRPAFDAWLDRKLDGVAGGIRRDAERWLRTLKDGGPRSRPAASPPSTATWARHCPRCWTGRHAITTSARSPATTSRTTCAACTAPSATTPWWPSARCSGSACSAGVIFRNPARGIKVGRRPSVTVLQPLGQDDIDDAVAAAVTPAARLIVALAGVHAARSSTICAMLLSDADPGSGRLLLGGRPRPLDDLTARLLRAWLEARRARWPGTANPHLLINAQTALGTGPASRTWATTALRGHAATIEALRVDRQLEEALATGADPLHLAATFGLDPGTAVRYASSARQLLQTAAEQRTRPSPREPKDRIRSRKLKTPQFPPTTLNPAELRGKRDSCDRRGVRYPTPTRGPSSSPNQRKIPRHSII